MLYVTSKNIEAVVKELMMEQLSEIADDGLDILKDCTPKVTGELAESMYKERSGEDTYFIGTDEGTCEHARWANTGNHAQGKGRHVGKIVPTQSAALNTPWGPKAHVSPYGGSHFTTTAAKKIARKYGVKATE